MTTTTDMVPGAQSATEMATDTSSTALTVFDRTRTYNPNDGTESPDLAEHSAFIRAERCGSLRGRIAIGRRLIASQDGTFRGGWERWVEDRCWMSIRTAQNYMLLARAFEPENAGLAFLTEEAALALAKKRIPPETRQKIIKKVIADAKPIGAEGMRKTLAKHGVQLSAGNRGPRNSPKPPAHEPEPQDDQDRDDDPGDLDEYRLAQEFVDLFKDEMVARLRPLLEAGDGAGSP